MNRLKHQNTRRIGGFTLIELMVTLVIISIMVSLGVPAMSALVERSQFKAETSKIHRAISLTRSNAVYRSEAVSLCPLNSSQTCGADWNGQLSVFSDSNSNGELDHGETILYSIPAIAGDSPLERAHSRNSPITFRPDGSAFGFNGTMSICLSGVTELSATVIVSSVGRIRIGQDTNEDGRVENSSGAPADCS